MRNILLVIAFGVLSFFVALYILYGSKRSTATVTQYSHTIAFALTPENQGKFSLDSGLVTVCSKPGEFSPVIKTKLNRTDYYSESLPIDSFKTADELLAKPNALGNGDGIVDMFFNRKEGALTVSVQALAACNSYDMRREFEVKNDTLNLYYLPVTNEVLNDNCQCFKKFDYKIFGFVEKPAHINVYRKSLAPNYMYYQSLGIDLYRKLVRDSKDYDKVRDRISPSADITLSDNDRKQLNNYLAYQDRVITFYAEQIDRLKNNNRYILPVANKQELIDSYEQKLVNSTVETAMILVVLRCLETAKVYINFSKQYVVLPSSAMRLNQTETTIKRDEKDLFGIYASISDD